MTIQEKKAKGMPFAIAKFSDNHGEYELLYSLKFLLTIEKNLKKVVICNYFVKGY